MSDTLALYSRIADDFAARLDAVPIDAWNRQSPCAGWHAADVAIHVVGVGLGYLAVAEGAPAPQTLPDWSTDMNGRGRAAVAAAGVAPAFAAMRARAEAAVADPARCDQPVPTPFGPLPLQALVAYVMGGDMLAHTWDLSRAAGLEEKVDDVAAAALLPVWGPLDDALRQPTVCEARIGLDEGARDGDRFLAFTGRPVNA